MSLKYLIGMRPDMEFVREYPDARDAESEVSRSRPDIVLTDIQLL